MEANNKQGLENYNEFLLTVKILDPMLGKTII